MLRLSFISFHEALRRRAGGLGTLLTGSNPCQKLGLIEVLIILYIPVTHLNAQRNNFKTGILLILFRQLTTTVHYYFVTHISST